MMWRRPFTYIVAHPGEATAIGTAILAVATLILAVVAIVTLRQTEYITKQSERAWLSPVAGLLQQPFEVDKVIRIAVAFTNTGREPAFDVTYAQENAIVKAPAFDDWATFSVGKNNTCDGLMPRPGALAVYPSSAGLATAFRTFDSGSGTNPLTATKSVIDGTFTYYMHGCVAYRTFGDVHHSAFCFVIYNPANRAAPGSSPPGTPITPPDQQTPPAAQNPGSQAIFVSCPTGHGGD